jgi:hypothetical protein
MRKVFSFSREEVEKGNERRGQRPEVRGKRE